MLCLQTNSFSMPKIWPKPESLRPRVDKDIGIFYPSMVRRVWHRQDRSGMITAAKF
jgi:hypothetical protein